MPVGIRKIAIRLPTIDVLPNRDRRAGEREDETRSPEKRRPLVPSVVPGLSAVSDHTKNAVLGHKRTHIGNYASHGPLPHNTSDITPYTNIPGSFRQC